MRLWATNQLGYPKRVYRSRTWFLLNSLAKKSETWIESGKRTEHNAKRNTERKQLKEEVRISISSRKKRKTHDGIFLLSYPSKTYQNVIGTHRGESTPRKDSQCHKQKSSAHHGRIDGYDHGRSSWWVDIVRYMDGGGRHGY